MEITSINSAFANFESEVKPALWNARARREFKYWHRTRSSKSDWTPDSIRLWNFFKRFVIWTQLWKISFFVPILIQNFWMSEKGNSENEILSENFFSRFCSKSKSSLSLSQNAVTIPAYCEADCCKDCSWPVDIPYSELYHFGSD